MYDAQNQAPYSMMSQYPNQPLQSPNPNPYPHFHSLSSDPSFSHPLPLSGFDPFPNSGYNQPSYTAIQAQPINYSDSNVDSSNWVVKQSGPIKYSHAVQPLKKEDIPSKSYDAPLNYSLVGQRLVNRLPKKNQKRLKTNPKKGAASQSVRCDVCKIECNNVHVYEKHLSGRKHEKGLLKLYAPALNAAAVKTAESGGASSKATDLEAKKQKLLEGGTAVQSLRICTICNVACNGEVVFSDHVSGKKHVAKERALGSMPNSNSILESIQKTTTQSNQTKKRKNGESKLAWCDVCKISCTSDDGLQIHLAGKKHQKNLQKLQDKETTNPSTGVNETASTTKPPKSSKVKKKTQSNDVNMKKQKILDSGTAASALKTCTVCNVVCNSETVFKSHLSGQKHVAMVKQAEALKGGPQVVDPAV